MSNNKRLRLERTSDEESFGEDSDSDEDIVLRSDHDTNSEEEATNSEIDEIRENADNFYIGKDGKTKWCSRKNIHQLWDNSKGNEMESCYLTMSEKRFRFLVRCLRFDDMHDRAVRKQFDKLAPIRDIFTLMVDNFQKYYCPSECVTIDEQLLAFRGKCPFRQYIPSKPAKYGIKAFALIDPRTVYTLNLETYLGVQPDGPYKISNASQDVVLRLVEPIFGTNRNITGDNWFTSMPLIISLKEKKLTYVGTVRKNKREIPKEFLPNKQRVETSSVFGFQKECTLVSYCPKKKNKTVSSTKTGVDLVDQYCQNSNVARNTKRWPMVIFYNLLNVAAINALCIYKANHTENIKIKRIDFLQDLSWELIKPQIQFRSTIETLPIELRRRAKILLGEKDTVAIETERPDGSRGRCYDYGRARDKTTRRWCYFIRDSLIGGVGGREVCYMIEKVGATSSTSNVNLPGIVEQNIVESEIQLVNADVNLVKNINKELESFVQTNEKGPICDVNTTSYDWSDPGNWPQLLTNTDKYEIVKLGPVRVENYYFPITIYENGQKRRFTANNYYCKLSNSDLIDRKWVVYSKVKDSVYCFPCKIFQQNKQNESYLCNIGLKDWKHLSKKLKSHETSKIHFQSIKSWMELNVRISKNLTIDKEHLAIIEKEKITGEMFLLVMDPSLHLYLLSKIKVAIQKEDTNMRLAIPAECKPNVTLRFLATGDSFSSLQYLFRIPKNTISANSVKEWKEIEKGFNEKWNFPGCIGAIDGKHVAIRAPMFSGSEYYNYKNSFSIILMTVVDANYCFRYIDIGAQGRHFDGGVFDHCSLRHIIEQNKLHIPENFVARRTVENAFGILVSRFRVFEKPIAISVPTAVKIVKTACALHNWLQTRCDSNYFSLGLIDREDLEHCTLTPGSWREESKSNRLIQLQPLPPRFPDRSARELRNYYCNYFNGVGAVPLQNEIIR
ncbi:hypothetical protein QTP88_010279 [Uroleucon formosanum]